MAYSKTDYRLSDGTDLIELFKNPDLTNMRVHLNRVDGAWIGKQVFAASAKSVNVAVSRDDYGRLIGLTMSCSEYVCHDYGDSCCNECDAGG